jgi:uncharacterized protein YjbI with pentapeptide repeats
MGDDGRPVHNQAFFIALARRGKDVWNEWQDGHREANVTFEGVNFGKPENMGIDFSGFEFHHANFRGCRFRGRESYVDPLASDPGTANFRAATFWDEANFSCATFGNSADFYKATFNYGSDFSGATFGIAADFVEAIFRDNANFFGAIFGHGANFYNASFYRADFSGATFGHTANFNSASFAREADFSALRAMSKARISNSMRAWTEERKQRFLPPREASDRYGAEPDGFESTYFRDAYFSGVADFSGRNFWARSDLRGARFDEPPRFNDCENTGRVDLYGARITFSPGTLFGFRMPAWTTDSDVGLRLRLLRKLAEETKNHDLERDLFIEERQAERGILLAQYFGEGWTVLFKPKFLTHCLWIAVMSIYWLLADYGRSFIRPLLALVASIFVFHGAYSMVLASSSTATDINIRRAMWAFTIANAIPFVGALTLEKEVKGIILCAGVPPGSSIGVEHTPPTCVPTVAFQLMALAQSIVSGLLVFFIALALRNFFKLH